jgi:hypothetical protein
MAKEVGGHVFVFNQSEAEMFDENPGKKRRRRRKAGGKKRKAHKRSNPAPKVTRRRRRRRAVSAAPAAPRRRRRRAVASARRSSRRRYRRNPSLPPFKSLGAAAIGGGLARGAVMLAEKVPVKNVYLALGIKAVAPAVVAIGAGMAGMERVAMGAAGAFGFQAPDIAISAYNTYKATAPATTTSSGTKGFGSIRQMEQARAAREGFGSIRTANGVISPR